MVPPLRFFFPSSKSEEKTSFRFLLSDIEGENLLFRLQLIIRRSDAGSEGDRAMGAALTRCRTSRPEPATERRLN